MKQKGFLSHTDVGIGSSEWDILTNILTRLQGEISHYLNLQFSICADSGLALFIILWSHDLARHAPFLIASLSVQMTHWGCANMAPFPDEVDVFTGPHWRMKQLVGLYCEKVCMNSSLAFFSLKFDKRNIWRPVVKWMTERQLAC